MDSWPSEAPERLDGGIRVRDHRSMRRPGFGCALLVLLLLLVPATASSLESASVAGDSSLTHYVGTKGVDDLTVSVEGPKWVFSRNAATQEAPIAAGTQCADTSGGEQKTVACDLTELTEIDLGDGADRLIGGATANELVVHAGPGQDLLTISSEESNVLDGEDGDDTFELGGGTGADTINGSAGDDLFREPVGADTINGGEGSDTVVYQLVPAESLTVTLDDQRNDGLSGDQNVNSDVEDLTGGQEKDRFVGSAAANLIKGAQGNDEIDGGAGQDTLEGGEDEDRILARDGEPDTVDCGFGQDTCDGRHRRHRLQMRGRLLPGPRPRRLRRQRRLRRPQPLDPSGRDRHPGRRDRPGLLRGRRAEASRRLRR